MLLGQSQNWSERSGKIKKLYFNGNRTISSYGFLTIYILNDFIFTFIKNKIHHRNFVFRLRTKSFFSKIHPLFIWEMTVILVSSQNFYCNPSNFSVIIVRRALSNVRIAMLVAASFHNKAEQRLLLGNAQLHYADKIACCIAESTHTVIKHSGQ